AAVGLHGVGGEPPLDPEVDAEAGERFVPPVRSLGPRGRVHETRVARPAALFKYRFPGSAPPVSVSCGHEGTFPAVSQKMHESWRDQLRRATIGSRQNLFSPATQISPDDTIRPAPAAPTICPGHDGHRTAGRRAPAVSSHPPA